MKSFKLFMEEQETSPPSEISAKEALGRFFPHVKIPPTEKEAIALLNALTKQEHSMATGLDTEK